ncbi:hypothetical protein MITS9509_02767 [Synechococcus sp. MIT S9509]|nr:hypothetical protein MITS9504_02120 [Synechococcus sp. MIT S9504]KZR90478.1 hypothetical protein MITS9509_02767 [Synechococcus sp. MIT S9509]
MELLGSWWSEGQADSKTGLAGNTENTSGMLRKILLFGWQKIQGSYFPKIKKRKSLG